MAGRARKGRTIGVFVLDASMRRLLMAQTNGKVPQVAGEKTQVMRRGEQVAPNAAVPGGGAGPGAAVPSGAGVVPGAAPAVGRAGADIPLGAAPVDDSPAEQVEKERTFRGGLREGLSVPQVAAGALAAVTSMLLSSKIGIAGSVIGVAVGSVVSTLSSQIYKQFLQASADKLRELSPAGDAAGDGVEMANGAGVSAGQASMAGATRVMDPAATRLMSQVGQPGAAAGISGPKSAFAGATRVIDPAATRVMGRDSETNFGVLPGQNGETVVMNPANVDGGANGAAQGAAGDDAFAGFAGATRVAATAAGSDAAGETPTRTVADLRAEGETGVLRGRAEHLRRQRMQRGVIVVSVVSSLVAVLLCAGIINLVTAGEGVGTKTEPLFSGTSTEQSAGVGSAKSSKQQAATSEGASDGQSSETAQNQGNPVHQDATTSESGATDAGQQGNASDSAIGSSQSGSSAGSTSGNANGSGSASGSQGAASGSGSSGSASGSSSDSSASGNGSASGSGSAGGSSQSGSTSGSSGPANGSSTGASTSDNAS